MAKKAKIGSISDIGVNQIWEEGYEKGLTDTPGNVERLNPYKGFKFKWWLRGFWAGWNAGRMTRGEETIPPAVRRMKVR